MSKFFTGFTGNFWSGNRPNELIQSKSDGVYLSYNNSNISNKSNKSNKSIKSNKSNDDTNYMNTMDMNIMQIRERNAQRQSLTFDQVNGMRRYIPLSYDQVKETKRALRKLSFKKAEILTVGYLRRFFFRDNKRLGEYTTIEFELALKITRIPVQDYVFDSRRSWKKAISQEISNNIGDQVYEFWLDEDVCVFKNILII